MFTQVTIYPEKEYATSAGKRTYFSLPRIGTTYLPREGRDLPLNFGIDRPFYVPEKLDLVIEYRGLKQSERIDSIAPARSRLANSLGLSPTVR